MMNCFMRTFAAVLFIGSIPVAFAAPTVSTGSSSNVSARTASVSLSLTIPSGESATYWFEYGTTPSYGKKSRVFSDVGPQTFTLQTGIGNLIPSTQHHWRAAAKGPTGATVYGADKTFTTTAATAIVIDPNLIGVPLVAAGDGFALRVNVTGGTNPVTYKWRRNGVLLKNSTGNSSLPNFIRGADDDRLTIDNVTAAAGGTYTCEVSNPDSPAQTTTPLVVSVLSISPALEITKKEGETFSLTATLTPANPGATYAWEADFVPSMTGYGAVSGLTSPTLTVANATPSAADFYLCKVTVGAVTLDSADVDVTILPKPVIDTESNVIVSVGELVNIFINVDNDPTVTKVTGLPAGLSYSASSGVISGKPLYPTGLDEPAVVVVNASNMAGAAVPMAFTITVNPLDPDMAGAFDGLVGRGVDNKGVGGQVTFVITPTADVTGTLLLDAGKYPFKGKLSVDSPGTSAQLLLQNLKSGSLPKVDSLVINLADDGTFSGSVATATGADSINNGRRNPWAAHNPFLTAGVFNCSLTPDSGTIANASLPHGHGFVSLTVSSLGVVTFTGKTSDGLVVTGKTSISAGGVVPLFAVQSSGKASLQGTPTITNKDVAGTCDWKSVSRTGRVYKNGFDLHTLTVLGKRYVKPQAGLNEIILGLANTTLNARLEFSDGGLGSSLGQNFTLTNLNVVQMPSGLSNPNVVSMKLDLVSGLIEGKFSVKDTNPLPPGQQLTRTASFYGLVIPGTGEARGFFTLAKLPSAGPPASNTSITTSDLLSGIAVLKAPVP